MSHWYLGLPSPLPKWFVQRKGLDDHIPILDGNFLGDWFTLGSFPYKSTILRKWSCSEKTRYLAAGNIYKTKLTTLDDSSNEEGEEEERGEKRKVKGKEEEQEKE